MGKEKKKPNEKNSKEKKSKEEKIELLKTVVLIALIILCLVGAGVIYYFNTQTPEAKEKELAYTELITTINKGEVEKLEMTTGSNVVTVTLKGEGEEKDRQKTVMVPSVQAFTELVQEKVDKDNVEINLKQEPVNIFLRVTDALFSFLPTILLVVLMFMIFKMQGLGGDSGKVYGGEDGSKKSEVRFDDIAGLDEEKNELIEIVDFLKEPKKFHDMGAKIPRGILL